MCRVCHSVYMSKTFNSPPLLLAMAAWRLIAPAPLSPIFVISRVFSTNLVRKINQYHTMQSSLTPTFQFLHQSVWFWYKITGMHVERIFITVHHKVTSRSQGKRNKFSPSTMGYISKCSAQSTLFQIILANFVGTIVPLECSIRAENWTSPSRHFCIMLADSATPYNKGHRRK